MEEGVLGDKVYLSLHLITFQVVYALYIESNQELFEKVAALCPDEQDGWDGGLRALQLIRVPIFVVVTRPMDSCPEHQEEDGFEQLRIFESCRSRKLM